MFHTVKLYAALFVLVAAVGAIPVFAHSLKRDSNPNAKTYTVEFHGRKNVPVFNRLLTRETSHSYRLTLRQGETAVFTVRSDKATTVRVKSPSGSVTEQKGEKSHQGVLSGAGEFVIEISSADISAYTLSVGSN